MNMIELYYENPFFKKAYNNVFSSFQSLFWNVASSLMTTFNMEYCNVGCKQIETIIANCTVCLLVSKIRKGRWKSKQKKKRKNSREIQKSDTEFLRKSS